MGAEPLVCKLQYLGRAAAKHSSVLYKYVRDHHKQRRAYTLIRNIGNDHCEMIVIYEIEVIEVSADLQRRCHGCVDIEIIPLRECRELLWQGVLLYRCCYGKLR